MGMRLLVFLICFVSLAIISRAQSLRSSNYTATVSIDLTQKIGTINPNIYGQYLEHVQRDDECIYPSLWDKTSPYADEHGLRKDVIEAARELGTPVVRWPGGCFADVYHWRDSIGPQATRPVRTNEHWGGLELNNFGTDEFLHWSKAVGSAAYINANLGTGTLEECVDWLNYCNKPTQRAAFWGIGNETFADWEAGHMDAPTYSRTLAEWAGAVHNADPKVQIIGVGSMSADNPNWDRTVLKQAGNLIDYLTIHAYGYSTGASNEFLSVAFTPVYFEQRLRKMLAVVDEFSAKRTNAEPIRLSMDEWNIRHYRDGQLNRKDPRNLQDAVFVAGVLNSMIRLSPRVGMANYVFLVNGNGVMLVNREQIVRTPLFHTFQQYGKWMQGEALAPQVTCPTTLPPLPQVHTPMHKPPPDFKITEQPWLDVIASLRSDGKLAIALINRNPDAAAKTKLQLPNGYKAKTTWTLSDKDVFAANTFAQPTRLVPQVKKHSSKTVICPPHSVSLILCEK